MVELVIASVFVSSFSPLSHSLVVVLIFVAVTVKTALVPLYVSRLSGG